MHTRSGSSHIGSALSCVDILTVLYFKTMSVSPARPLWESRDRFILSKGHAASALYAVLAVKGFFPKKWLDGYSLDNGKLPGHATRGGIPGIEFSAGSLGHGLSVGCGLALNAKRESRKYRTFVLLSDGECDEGSTWEAALFAGHHGLDNLAAVIDYNKLQAFGRISDVLGLEPLAEKWKSFGWETKEIDGHNHAEIERSLAGIPCRKGRPTVIIAHTVKGKGVSFMEDRLVWHYKSPSQKEMELALKELNKK